MTCLQLSRKSRPRTGFTVDIDEDRAVIVTGSVDAGC